MKRFGNLWQRVIAFENLLRAAEKASRGKRFRPPVARFHFDLEHELWSLHAELAAKTYQPGAYRTFYLYQPKKRQISAAPFRDRVVHHALTNVLERLFEHSFLFDSYEYLAANALFVVPESAGNLLAERARVQSPGRCPVSGYHGMARPKEAFARQVW